MSGTFVVVTAGALLLSSLEEGPEMLLNIPRCAGQLLTAKNHPGPNVSSV